MWTRLMAAAVIVCLCAPAGAQSVPMPPVRSDAAVRAAPAVPAVSDAPAVPAVPALPAAEADNQRWQFDLSTIDLNSESVRIAASIIVPLVLLLVIGFLVWLARVGGAKAVGNASVVLVFSIGAVWLAATGDGDRGRDRRVDHEGPLSWTEQRIVKRDVRRALKDPDSARFGRMTVGYDPASELRIVCGTVNARNSFGGYTGPRLFAGAVSAKKNVFVLAGFDGDFGDSGVILDLCRAKAGLVLGP